MDRHIQLRVASETLQHGGTAMSNVLPARRIWLGLCLALAAGWHMPATRAADAKGTVAQIIATIASTPSAEQIDAKLSGQVDYAAITQMAFTPEQWSSFTAPQRELLKHAYRELISKRYYMRWHKLFARSTVAYGDAAQSNGDAYIRTSIKHAKDTDKVTWRLRNNNGRLALLDINVNDKDLIGRLSQRSQAELKKQGVNKFLVWVQQEASQSRETATASSTKGSAAEF
jgi:ABC-type transporter MlaC component